MRRFLLGLVSATFLVLAILEIYLGRARLSDDPIESSERPFSFWFAVGLHLAIGIACTVATIYADRIDRDESSEDS